MITSPLKEREKRYLDSLRIKDTNSLHNIFVTPKVICETH